MLQCAVIADDLTGANATGVMLRNLGLRTATLFEEGMLQQALQESIDCVCVSSDSRGLSPSMAAVQVRQLLGQFEQSRPSMFSKRIDSTLRGNLGSETESILTGLGKSWLALIVPSFPDAGRTVIDGRLFVNDIPLMETGAASDPINPVHSSSVLDCFAEQTTLQRISIHIGEVRRGEEYLAGRIQELRKEGYRLIALDAETNADIQILARAARQLSSILAVDPGPFTAKLAGERLRGREIAVGDKILAVIGSVNPVAYGQLQNLMQAEVADCIFVDAECFLQGELRRKQEIQRVLFQVSECVNQVRLVVVKGIRPGHRVNFEPYVRQLGCTEEELSNRINGGMAELACAILTEDPAVGALYLSGGDIARSVCRRIGAGMILLEEEVVPLAACGTIGSGSRKGMLVVTKGGMAGDDRALTNCIEYLRGRLNDDSDC